MANTANRGYPKPVSENFISSDVSLLIQAFDMIDADVVAFIAALAGKAALNHGHSLADISGLTAALADLAPLSHNHALATLSDTAGLAGVPDGYVLRKLAGTWQGVSAAALFAAHTHIIGDITGLSAVLADKLDAATLAGATAKGTPVDADTIPLSDSASSGALKRLSFANLWVWIKAKTDALYAPASILTVPSGAVLDFAGATAPTGYLMCYGQAVSRTSYAALFAAIGSIHGAGDGSTTFNLPDYRGRVGAGKDDMGGVSANRLTSPIDGDVLGAAGGAESHLLTAAQIPAHSHTATTTLVAAPDHTHTTGRATSTGSGGTPATVTNVDTGTGNSTITGPAGAHNHVATTTVANSTGGDTAHPNVQPTLITNKIIKT